MKPRVPVRDVPPERKALYYAGMAAGVLGLLLFGSNFLIVASSFDDPFSMRDQTGGFVARALGGMALMAAGSGMMRNTASSKAGFSPK